MFIFYKLFDEAIPQKVLREFYVLNHKKDFNIDEMINQYLVASNDNRIHHIILKCKKGIDIQYFSIELSNILGYSHSILINESLDYIFPAVFKGYHKKAMINYLTTHSNFMFEKNNTFIFDVSLLGTFLQFHVNLYKGFLVPSIYRFHMVEVSIIALLVSPVFI